MYSDGKGEVMRALKPSEIKKIREDLEMSQAQFAKAFHLNFRTVQQWEQGVSKPSGPTAVLLWLIGRIPHQILNALKDG
jgi:putative transcriptional regulator